MWRIEFGNFDVWVDFPDVIARCARNDTIMPPAEIKRRNRYAAEFLGHVDGGDSFQPSLQRSLRDPAADLAQFRAQVGRVESAEQIWLLNKTRDAPARQRLED